MKAEEIDELAEAFETAESATPDLGIDAIYVMRTTALELLADARLAARLRKFVEEHGDAMRNALANGWTVSSTQNKVLINAAAFAFRELLAAARGEKT